jgi:pimeloyl-ACP methyl ester carboxylesterase
MPGLDGTGVLFGPLLAALPSSVQATPLSYPAAEVLSYADLAARVRAELPVAEPYVLVGESYSGPLALMLAKDRPPALHGVVLSASFVRSPAWWAPRPLRHGVTSHPFRLFPAFAKAKALLGGYSTPELQRLLAQAHRAVAPAVLAARVREVLAVDVVEELRTCPVPILYIRGLRDRVVPERSLRLVLRVRPSVQVVRVSAPHLVLQTQPSACAEAICSFAVGARVA